MILSVAVLFLGLGVALVLLAYFSRTSGYGVMGFLFLLFTFLSMMQGGLSVPDGTITNSSYSYKNQTGSIVINTTTTTEAPQYVALSDTTTKRLGLYGLVVSLVGIFAVIQRHAKDESIKGDRNK